jgi:eukaryotic-like serine/threonine-protein kinase
MKIGESVLSNRTNFVVYRHKRVKVRWIQRTVGVQLTYARNFQYCISPSANCSVRTRTLENKTNKDSDASGGARYVPMFEGIVGCSAPLRCVLEQVAKVAATDSTVLILGETGTGKEMIAQAIHKGSKRSSRPFIAVNCAAVPPTLVATELFGHEKGAFTGATQRRLGRFELADGGTIFLDEVGELAADIQSTVLRVLQERQFERVGGSDPVSVDVRVVSATNRDLRSAVERGTFRRDLFYRLEVFPIEMPPLRKRSEDIPLLAEHFVGRCAGKVGKRFSAIDQKTLELLRDYPWPGNIRELQNIVERAAVLCDDDTFSIDEAWLRVDVPPEMRRPRVGRLDEAQARQMAEARRMIEAALAETGGRISGPTGAAALLGIPRQTLQSKIASLGIDKNKFKPTDRRDGKPARDLNAELPQESEKITDDALENEQESRHSQATEIRTDLPPPRPDLRRGRYWVTAVLSVLVVLAVATWLYRFRHPLGLTEKDSIVLADFTNSTGEPIFDDTLKQALAIDLEQSQLINILSQQRVNATLKLMNRKPGERIVQETAREICQRTGSRAVLDGLIAKLGGHYVIGLMAVNCRTGDSMGSAEAEADSPEKIMKALSETADTLRVKLGESLASVQKHAKPLEEATTSSLGALLAFTQGSRTASEKGDQYALPYLKRAVELDGNFARAYASLGARYINLNQASLAITNYKKAFELRDRVSERERFYIESMYYVYATGELEKAVEVLTQYVQTYPNDADAHASFAAALYNLGQWEKSKDESFAALRLDPDNGFNLGVAIADYLLAGRPKEVRALYDEARKRGLENSFPETGMYVASFMLHDEAGMREHYARAMGKAEFEDILLAMQSDTEAYYGRLEKSRELSRRAADAALKNGAVETSAMWRAYGALHQAEAGNVNTARQQAEAALAVARGRDVRVLAALAFARNGDAARAQELADGLNRDFPLDTLMQHYTLPVVHALVAVDRADGKRALELLGPTEGYELASPQSFVNTEPPVYPMYARGEAYLKSGNPQQAAAEFQKMLSNSWNYPLFAHSHLQLGRAKAMGGDTVGARKEYEEFFALWKDADPDIPLLRDAKTEYEKLKQ